MYNDGRMFQSSWRILSTTYQYERKDKELYTVQKEKKKFGILLRFQLLPLPKSRKQNFNYNYHHNLYDYYDVVNADVDVDDDDYVDDAEEYGAARTSPVVLSGCLLLYMLQSGK